MKNNKKRADRKVFQTETGFIRLIVTEYGLRSMPAVADRSDRPGRRRIHRAIAARIKLVLLDAFGV